MRTIPAIFLACLTITACEDQGAKLEDALTITVTVLKDTIPGYEGQEYYWRYLAQSNIDATIYRIHVTGPPFKGFDGIWWPDPLRLKRGEAHSVGGELCDSSSYPSFCGIRKVTLYGSTIADERIEFSRTTEVMIQ